MEPRITCPHCNQLVRGLADTRVLSEISNSKGLSKGPAPYDYIQSPGVGEIDWRLSCGCRVDQGFAGMYGKEIAQRKEGRVPQDINAAYNLAASGEQKVLEQQLKDARHRLKQVGQMGSDPGLNGVLLQAERKVIYAYDRLMKIGVPPIDVGPPLLLTEQSYAWAEKNNMLTPPRPPGYAKPADGYMKTPVNPSQVLQNQKVKGWMHGLGANAAIAMTPVTPLVGANNAFPLPDSVVPGLVASGAYELTCTIPGNAAVGDYLQDKSGEIVGVVTSVTSTSSNNSTVHFATLGTKLPPQVTAAISSFASNATSYSTLPQAQPKPEPMLAPPVTSPEPQQAFLRRTGRLFRRNTHNIPDKE